MTVAKKKRRRKNDPNTPEGQAARDKRKYFNQDTHDAIVEWQVLSSAGKHVEANKLYTKRIDYPFHKMCECMVNIHKFTLPNTTFADLVLLGVTNLFETLPKFNPDFGSPAFSYFNQVAKNFFLGQFLKARAKDAPKSSYEAMLEAGWDPESVRTEDGPSLDDNLSKGDEAFERQLRLNDVLYDFENHPRGVYPATWTVLRCIDELIADPPPELLDARRQVDAMRVLKKVLLEKYDVNEKQCYAAFQQVREAERKTLDEQAKNDRRRGMPTTSTPPRNRRKNGNTGDDAGNCERIGLHTDEHQQSGESNPPEGGQDFEAKDGLCGGPSRPVKVKWVRVRGTT